ncbi:MAG TPA: DUF4062 domain-containing protein [Kiritimatiellia bacterium]|nr:DUF4062 domain-containing protein [Kiritimatiellia bacterium]
MTVDQSPALGVDALKRRYQVFVSSTYEDLKEERQHVIQALLETKCIPLGMELFPAASVEQWELIKRVIDECDYYIVIVAGRYGSLNKEGKSYTEMEFDYALKIGKPILAFCHKDVEALAVCRTERTDLGNQRLTAFTEKVRSNLCRFWSSPAELGSAVKSAIIHALEFTPKPGWIRAESLPNSDGTERLKQRIADLEKQLKKQSKENRQNFASGDEVVEMPLVINHDFQETEDEFGFPTNVPTNSFEHEVKMTWDELVLILHRGLQEGRTLDDLKGLLERELCKRLEGTVAQHLSETDPKFSIEFEDFMLEPLLKTLMARKLVKMTVGSFGSWSNPNWRFTPQGLQYLAELQAIRSTQ